MHRYSPPNRYTFLPRDRDRELVQVRSIRRRVETGPTVTDIAEALGVELPRS